MAEFNPKTSTVDIPNFLSRSRGFDAGLASSTMIEGAANIFDQAVQAADTVVKSKIEDEARMDFDALNEAHLVDVGVTPPELANSEQKLARLQAAMQAGKISPTYYYGNMASQLKSLRSRYPGYEGEVDAIVQRVTGTRPANAYRDALFSEIEALERSASSADTKWDTFVNQNLEYIFEAFGPTYFENAEKYDRDDVRTAVAFYQHQKYKRDEQKSQLDVAAKKNQLEGEASERVFTQEAIAKVATRFNQLQRALGDDFTKITPTTDAATLESFRQQIVQLRSQTRLELENLANQPFSDDSQFSYRSTIGNPTRVGQVIDGSLAVFDEVLDALDNKDYGRATAAARLVAAQVDRQTVELMEKVPGLRVMASVRDLAPEMVPFLAGESQMKLTGDIVDIMATIGSVENTVPADEVLKGIQDGNMSRVEANEHSQNYFRNMQKFIEGDIPIDQSRKAVESFVSGMEKGMMSLVQPSEQGQLFNEVYSLKATEKVREINDPALTYRYFESARRSFPRIHELRQLGARIGQLGELKTLGEVRLNEATNRLEFIEGGDTTQRGRNFVARFEVMRKGRQTQELKNLLSEFNNHLAAFLPTAELVGANETEVLKEILREMDIDLQSQNVTDNVWGMIHNVVDSIFEEGEINTPLQDLSELEFGEDVLDTAEREIAEALDIGELGGRADDQYKTLLGHSDLEGKQFSDVDVSQMTIDEAIKFASPRGAYGKFSRGQVGRTATPMGRYQIVGTTLRDLKRTMGLKGDELFDADMQDDMFRVLLRRRGYDKYIRGEISFDKFLEGMKLEWEGLITNSESRQALKDAIG